MTRRVETMRSRKEPQIGRDLKTMLVPDSILLSQWQPTQSPSPERKLAYAILDEALECLKLNAVMNGSSCSKTRKRSTLQQDALNWFLSDADDYVFSFVNVCHALILDPEWFRRKMREKKVLA